MFKKQKGLCGWNILSKEDNDMIGFLADRLIKEAGAGERSGLEVKIWKSLAYT